MTDLAHHLITYALFFISALLFVIGAYRYFSRDQKATRKANQRLATIDPAPRPRADPNHLRRGRFLALTQRWAVLDGFESWLIQSGLRFEPGSVVLIFTGLVAVFTTLAALGLGFGLLAFLLGVGASILAILIYISISRSKRIRKCQDQLPDVIDAIVVSIKAGHPLQTAMSLIARDMPDPLGSEFGIAFDEVTYGHDIPGAMRNLSDRIGDPDLVYFVTSVAIQTQTGGNLAEILKRLSVLLRERATLRKKIRSLSAQGRASAKVLGLLPVAVFAAIYLLIPNFYTDVMHNKTFHNALILSGILLGVGNYVISRMIDFRY